MITLEFLGTWLKITAWSVFALFCEFLALHGWWFVVIGLVTVLVFLGLTAALWREWRAARRGDSAYTYQLIRYLGD